jgi:Ca2+-binding EF-hand superfamily protein
LETTMTSRVDPLEPQIDLVETKLRDSLMGKHFGEKSKMKAEIKKVFQQYDTSGDNKLTFEEFECALVRDFNLVGMHRAVRGLFDRYDDDYSERLSYEEFVTAILGRQIQKTNEGRSVVSRVKNMIIGRGGALGIRSMTVILRRMDRNGNKKLDASELQEGLEVYGIHPDKEEMKTIMHYFDRDGDRSISVTEFLRGIRGRMPRCRAKLVRQAFNLLDKTGDEEITLEDLVGAYDASSHPEVVSGGMTEGQVLTHFLDVWDKSRDGIVTWIEFLDYYKDISVGIDRDDYFELMMRNAWHLSGGEGKAQNTTCLRVLVDHTDGSQTIEEVQNDLGLKRGDLEGIQARLEKQGINDIKEISLS